MTPDRLFRLGLGFVLVLYSLKTLKDLGEALYQIVTNSRRIANPWTCLGLIVADLVLFLIGYLIATE